MESQPPQFLDVPTLLERSVPYSRPVWALYAVGAFILLAILSGLGGMHPNAAQLAVQIFSVFLMICLVAASAAMIWAALKRYRAEQKRISDIEELVLLRRWPEAAMTLQAMLSQPARSPVARVRALLYLTSVLARYHRFADALVVQEYLLDHVQLDPAGEYALKLGRAMAMLREDQLLDADRAIAGLRKLAASQGAGGLSLVELYRDVKTGHPHEAIDLFTRRLGDIRRQLGHRLGEAYALVARAYDMVGRDDDARAAWTDATLLSPPVELLRRYPEIRPLAAKYPATLLPAGME